MKNKHNNLEQLLGINISSTDTKTSFSAKRNIFQFAEENNIYVYSLFLPKIKKELFVPNVSGRVYAHSMFSHNPCSFNEDNRNYSYSVLRRELYFCKDLNIKYLVFHPGSNRYGEKILESLNNLCNFFEEYSREENEVILLLENSCGSGGQLFSKLDHFQYVFEKISSKAKNKIGICLDTCHLFQSGFDVSSFDTFYNLVKRFNDISDGRVYLFHLNDSKADINSHLDRHEKIGFGKIGEKLFFNTKYISLENKIPMILETPSTTFDRIFERIELLKLNMKELNYEN